MTGKLTDLWYCISCGSETCVKSHLDDDKMGPGFPSIHIFYRFTTQFPVFHVVLLIAPEPPTGPLKHCGVFLQFTVCLQYLQSAMRRKTCLATVILLYQVTFDHIYFWIYELYSFMYPNDGVYLVVPFLLGSVL